jgi:hypothetical protein
VTANELDELLQDRFDMHIPNLIAALNTLPASRPWAASLTANEARLLDEAGFVEDPRRARRPLRTRSRTWRGCTARPTPQPRCETV